MSCTPGIQIQPRCCVTECAWCNGVIPSEFEVTFSGIMNASCSNCTDLNTTYYLPFYGQIADTYCVWMECIPDVCGSGYTRIMLWVFEGSTPGTVSIYVFISLEVDTCDPEDNSGTGAFGSQGPTVTSSAEDYPIDDCSDLVGITQTCGNYMVSSLCRQGFEYETDPTQPTVYINAIP